MATQIFVNLPVKDLDRSMEFFKKLGYTFNAQFTNEQAAALVISDTIYAMLLTEPFFKGFTKKEITDTSKASEAILAFSADSRAEVDEMIAKAVAAGATTPNEKQDHGFMYSHGFDDLDGHAWEYFWMNPEYVQEG